jgi:tetratricopeptide (TPR) repeat protein
MKRRVFQVWKACALMSVLMCVVLMGAVAQTPEVDKAFRLAELDQRKKAVESLEALVAKTPTDAKLWYYLAVVQLNGGDIKGAASSFDRGISTNEKEPLNYAGKGTVLMQNKKAGEAQPLFDKALTLSKQKDPAVLNAVASAYLVDNYKVTDAITLLKKASGIDPKNVHTHILLGDAYLAMNNGGEALTAYENAAKANPSAALPHYKIGLLYSRSRNVDAALEGFSKAISVDPEYTLAYKELGELYYLRKDGVNAAKAYENYMRLTENPEEGKLRYAFFLFMAKDFEKANNVFKEAVQKPDVPAVAWRYYAYSLFESGKVNESNDAFQSYFAAVPADQVTASDYAYFAKLLLKQGKDSLAVIQIDKSLALEANQTDLLQLKGETAMKIKDYPATITAYEALLPLRKKPLSQDYYNLGRACYFEKQYEKADSSFQKLIELQPQMTVGYLWLGRTKASLDPESEAGLAKPYYEKVIELASATPEKSKNDLIEAYSYLGYYQFLKNDTKASRSSWEKVLQLDPKNEKAKEALGAIH